MAIDTTEHIDQPESGVGQGLLKGLTVTMKTMLRPAVTVQYPHVKPDLPARTRGVIALKQEQLHRLLQVLARVPRLVHLHRRPQGDARAGGRWPRPLDEGARPFRDRLRALHVLRHLRRGVPVRRAVLEPRVRVRGVRDGPAHPREGATRGVDLHGAAAARHWRSAPEPSADDPRGRRRPRERTGVRLLRARGGRRPVGGRRGDRAQRRARRALPGGLAARRSAGCTCCSAPSSWPGCRS